MFETMVLVCLATNPSFCYTLTDLYGPYYTKKECINRAYIIARDLQEYMPNFEVIKYKCLDILDKRVDKKSV
jgi:hypothetical protein